MKAFKPLATAVLALLLLFGASACDLAGLNDDPNNPIDVAEKLQLPALLANFSYEIIGGDPARTPTHWTQQLAYNGVQPSEDTYDVDESDVNNLWQYMSYTDVMKNARILDEQAAANGNFAYAGIAKVIFAWNLSVVTDLWGEVPFSEAFDPDNPTPAYDDQEQVYQAVFSLLDGAIADFGKASPLAPGADDLLYGGDMGRWERLAYTLKARLLMHLTEAPGYDAATQAQKALDALANGFDSNADDADFDYADQPGSENPWYQWTIDGKWDTRNQLSAHYVGLLRSKDDPRLPVQARPVGAVDGSGVVQGFETDDPQYVGHENGVEGIGASNVSSIGSYYSAPGASLSWLTYAEAKFIEAEATLILSGPQAAEPIYEEAIAASMTKLGVSAEERDAYIAARPALTAGNALEQIITEKYVANFLSFEVYNDWRRTGFPVLEPVEGGKVATIPVRYPYPSSELSNNPESVSKTGIPVGYDALTIPIWWDTTPAR